MEQTYRDIEKALEELQDVTTRAATLAHRCEMTLLELEQQRTMITGHLSSLIAQCPTFWQDSEEDIHEDE